MHRASFVGVLRCSSTAGTETTLVTTGVSRLAVTFETAFAGLLRFTGTFITAFAGLPRLAGGFESTFVPLTSFTGTFATALAGLPLFNCTFVDTLFAVVTLFLVLGIVSSS